MKWINQKKNVRVKNKYFALLSKSLGKYSDHSLE